MTDSAPGTDRSSAFNDLIRGRSPRMSAWLWHVARPSGSMRQPLFDLRFVVFPERLSVVVVRHTLENASDKGIVRGPLPGPTLKFFCKLAFLPAALTDLAPYDPTRVEGADGEAGSDVSGSYPFHHFANCRTRPDPIFIG